MPASRRASATPPGIRCARSWKTSPPAAATSSTDGCATPERHDLLQRRIPAREFLFGGGGVKLPARDIVAFDLSAAHYRSIRPILHDYFVGDSTPFIFFVGIICRFKIIRLPLRISSLKRIVT